MKVLVPKTSLRLILKLTQRALFAGAALMLGYGAFVLADSWMFQHRQMQTLARLRTAPSAASAASPTAFASLAASASPAKLVKVSASLSPAIGPDGLIGRMEIQRLALSVAVMEGTGAVTLRRAAGHIAGTALPGQTGNIGIAAHRDTFFRPLRNIQRDDIITLTTLQGEYRYRVVSTKVVSPSDVAVLNPDGSEVLTLVTCYPFYFIGAAPDRFIVRAARIL
jgi:sortase A